MIPVRKTLDQKIMKFANPMDTTQLPRYHHKTLNCLLGFLVLKKIADFDEDIRIDWQQVAKKKTGIADTLNAILEQIEDRYPELRNWFNGLDFNESFRRDETARNNIWQEVISEFSDVDYTNISEEGQWSLTELCLFINEHWFKDMGYGQISSETPFSVIQLETELINPPEKSSIYDPFCACGTSLVIAARFVNERSPDQKIRLCGQTLSESHRLTAYLNLLLTDNENSKIVEGDVIRNPGFKIRPRKLAVFQRIIGTIPTGIQNWGEYAARNDKFARFTYGIPPATQGDFAYLQHCIASLTDDGMIAIAVPPSILFKERSEGSIRQGIIKDDLIEAVILLPKKLYRETSMNYAILVINRLKSPDRKNKVIFIDGTKDFHPGRLQNSLSADNLQKIVTAFKEFVDVDGYCAVCSLEEIEKNRCLLDVARYVKESREVHTPIDMRASISELDMIHKEKLACYDAMRVKLGVLVKHIEENN
jgi:type I restriction enzyme M protein